MRERLGIVDHARMLRALPDAPAFVTCRKYRAKCWIVLFITFSHVLRLFAVSRLEVIKSNKGHHKVIHLGFMYTKHKAMGDRIRWRCVQRSTHCKGSIFTTPDFNDPRVTVNHNHVPDIDAVEFARCRTMIAERVNRLRIRPPNQGNACAVDVLF